MHASGGSHRATLPQIAEVLAGGGFADGVPVDFGQDRAGLFDLGGIDNGFAVVFRSGCGVGHGDCKAPPRSRADQPRQAMLEPEAGGAGAQRAFPDGDDVPALLAEGFFVAQVAGTVAVDLAFPPCAAGRGQAEGGTMLMPVPEAAVDEDHGAVFRQDDVGFSGKEYVFRAVDREAVAEPVEHRAQGEFRLGVAPADAGHDLGAFLRREDVGHG